jgi:hypothetical protein
MASLWGLVASDCAARWPAAAWVLALEATAVPIPAPPRARTLTAMLAIFGASFMLVPFAGCVVLTLVSLHPGPCDGGETNL